METTKRRKINTVVFKESIKVDDYIVRSLVLTIDLLKTALESVPYDSRESAAISFYPNIFFCKEGDNTDINNSVGEITISYWREETDEEFNSRTAKEYEQVLKDDTNSEFKEKETMYKLMNKYGIPFEKHIISVPIKKEV